MSWSVIMQCRCFIAPCVRAYVAFWRRLCASTYISHSFCHMKRAQIRAGAAALFPGDPTEHGA
jgi:hypothetical protein